MLRATARPAVSISSMRCLTHSRLTFLPIRSLIECCIAVSVPARPSWQMMDSNSISLTLGAGAACAKVVRLGSPVG